MVGAPSDLIFEALVPVPVFTTRAAASWKICWPLLHKVKVKTHRQLRLGWRLPDFHLALL